MSVIFHKGQNYCINCKSCKTADDQDDWKCLHSKNISVDLLTGTALPAFYNPGFLRREESGPDSCGVKGRWFEKAEGEKMFLVQWSVNIDADNYHEAAKKALEIQRDPTSIATVFEVANEGIYKTIDLRVSAFSRHEDIYNTRERGDGSFGQIKH